MVKLEIELNGQKIDLDNLQSGYFNMDCMDGMAKFPDKYFDLAVVDPPYGININNNMGRRHGDKKSTYPRAFWDSKVPDKEYFDELFRVSQSQIIWGGNYYELPPTKCFLVWRKPNISEGMSFSMLEYAWTSLNSTSKEFIGMSNEKDRIHATQKPIALYQWIFNLFAQHGMKILDTHVGSASSLIAAHDAGLTYIGFEIDEYYYKLSKKRLDEYTEQMNIFDFIDREE